MRRIIVLLVFAAVVGVGLWWSLFPTEESQRPRQMTVTSEETEEVPAEPIPRPPAEADPVQALARLEPVPESVRAPDGTETEAETDIAASTPTPLTPREVERVLIETKVAGLASSLGLITPVELESRVERAVPGAPEEERAPVRRAILAKAAVLDALAKKKLGPDASPAEIRRISDLMNTYSSAEWDDIKDDLMSELAASLPES